MKQTAQKKPKVFRTLIRRIHMGNKAVQKDNKMQTAGKNGKTSCLSFSASNGALCKKHRELFLIHYLEGG